VLDTRFGIRRLMTASALVAVGLAGVRMPDIFVATTSIMMVLVGPPLALCGRHSTPKDWLMLLCLWTVPVSLTIVLYILAIVGGYHW
jgi:hypothetical protein